jgi:FkbM family methyltransferase
MDIKQTTNRILSHLPGTVGRKHKRRYYRHLTEAVEREFRAVVGRLTSRSLALDLGANVGEYTKILANNAGKVVAFEPDPYAFGLLQANTRHLPNVELIQAAVSTESGTITLYRRQDYDEDPTAHSQGSSLYSSKDNIDEHNHFDVRCIDIVQFIEDLDREVALIKIDIEGAEVPILERLLESPAAARIGHVFVETHEFKIPELYRRTERLRKLARKITEPRVHLNWR